MTAFDDGLWTRLVDEHDADRVTLHAGHPRASRGPLVLGVSALTAGALIGILAAALSLAGHASPAFARWTARPTTPTAAQLADTRAYCAANVPTPGLPLKLVDARGPFTFEVFANATQNDFCTTGPSFENASGWSTSAPVVVASGNLHLWTEHTLTTVEGETYGIMIARAGDDVSAATLALEDGTDITATVQNGWAVAWWPGSHEIVRATLTTPAGSQAQTFPLSPCEHPLDKCGGGSHGAAPGGGPGGG